MPLIYAPEGQKLAITHIAGQPATRRRLQELGFVKGESLQIISHLAGNLIVRIKDCRVALGRDLAANILV